MSNGGAKKGMNNNGEVVLGGILSRAVSQFEEHEKERVNELTTLQEQFKEAQKKFTLIDDLSKKVEKLESALHELKTKTQYSFYLKINVGNYGDSFPSQYNKSKVETFGCKMYDLQIVASLKLNENGKIGFYVGFQETRSGHGKIACKVDCMIYNARKKKFVGWLKKKHRDYHFGGTRWGEDMCSTDVFKDNYICNGATHVEIGLSQMQIKRGNYDFLPEEKSV